jgi:hypothetical protein
MKRKAITWLGLFNFIILQWLFVRLAEEVETVTGKRVRFRLLIGIIPLTGWINNFVYINPITPYVYEMSHTLEVTRAILRKSIADYTKLSERVYTLEKILRKKEESTILEKTDSL